MTDLEKPDFEIANQSTIVIKPPLAEARLQLRLLFYILRSPLIKALGRDIVRNVETDPDYPASKFPEHYERFKK